MPSILVRPSTPMRGPEPSLPASFLHSLFCSLFRSPHFPPPMLLLPSSLLLFLHFSTLSAPPFLSSPLPFHLRPHPPFPLLRLFRLLPLSPTLPFPPLSRFSFPPFRPPPPSISGHLLLWHYPLLRIRTGCCCQSAPIAAPWNRPAGLEFINAQDAKEAQQRCDGMVVDGARIIVEMSKPTNQPSNPPRCFTCGQEGHRSTDCPDRQRQHHSQVVCFGCKQPGHLHKHCPNRPAMPAKPSGVPSGSGVILDSAAGGMIPCAAAGMHEAAASGVKCFGCNASGHVLKDCPQISVAGADQHEKQRRWDKRHSSPTSRQHSP
ncbi:unnamed protein product, partial [Closterium sp. Naga37s-1]